MPQESSVQLGDSLSTFWGCGFRPSSWPMNQKRCVSGPSFHGAFGPCGLLIWFTQCQESPPETPTRQPMQLHRTLPLKIIFLNREDSDSEPVPEAVSEVSVCCLAQLRLGSVLDCSLENINSILLLLSQATLKNHSAFLLTKHAPTIQPNSSTPDCLFQRNDKVYSHIPNSKNLNTIEMVK